MPRGTASRHARAARADPVIVAMVRSMTEAGSPTKAICAATGEPKYMVSAIRAVHGCYRPEPWRMATQLRNSARAMAMEAADMLAGRVPVASLDEPPARLMRQLRCLMAVERQLLEPDMLRWLGWGPELVRSQG